VPDVKVSFAEYQSAVHRAVSYVASAFVLHEPNHDFLFPEGYQKNQNVLTIYGEIQDESDDPDDAIKHLLGTRIFENLPCFTNHLNALALLDDTTRPTAAIRTDTTWHIPMLSCVSLYHHGTNEGTKAVAEKLTSDTTVDTRASLGNRSLEDFVTSYEYAHKTGCLKNVATVAPEIAIKLLVSAYQAKPDAIVCAADSIQKLLTESRRFDRTNHRLDSSKTTVLRHLYAAAKLIGSGDRPPEELRRAAWTTGIDVLALRLEPIPANDFYLGTSIGFMNLITRFYDVSDFDTFNAQANRDLGYVRTLKMMLATRVDGCVDPEINEQVYTVAGIRFYKARWFGASSVCVDVVAGWTEKPNLL
jgi:hypothetical protein